MADTPSYNMLTYDVIIHYFIVAAQSLTGIFINGFIVVLNVVVFIRQRQMDPLDLIISCLAISRICRDVLSFLLPLALFSLIKHSVLHVVNILFTFTNIWGLWMATWLNVFYCAKIADIQHPLFFWLKRNISKLVPWLILGSILYAANGTSMHRNYLWTITQTFLKNFFSSNETHMKRIVTLPLSILVFHLIIPLSIFFIAVLLLVSSLGRHVWKMRTITSGTQDHCFSAPLKAIMSILSVLILYVCYYTTIIVFSTQDSQYRRLYILFWSLIGGFYPTIHSVILILASGKLIQYAKMFLLCGLCGQ